MPRLSPSVIRTASRESKYLPALLKECRDLSSARNELRWLKEHVKDSTRNNVDKPTPVRLSNLVLRRSKGEPLQYLLGNQPFGALDVLCKPGVLIPRPETETYTTKVAQCLQQLPDRVRRPRTGLRILDLCTGTGCIALLLHSLLSSGTTDDRGQLQIAGLDISPEAIDLAELNLIHNAKSGSFSAQAEQQVSFHAADVLALGSPTGIGETLSHLVGPPLWRLDGTWDIVISNPPYISASDFALGGTTTRSVRIFEPKLALVPPQDAFTAVHDGDIFYSHILGAARDLHARLIVMEIGDSQQAQRVYHLSRTLAGFEGRHLEIEVWNDDGSVRFMSEHQQEWDPELTKSPDDANARAVVIWRGSWALWRKESRSHVVLRT